MATKSLLKRGALLVAANWQTVAIQFAAETTFQLLLAVPLVGALLLFPLLIGPDAGVLLQGGAREMIATIANALMSEPLALTAFITSVGIVVIGGSVLTFLAKGGIVEVLLAANDIAGSIETEPLTWVRLRSASRFSVERFLYGSTRLFRRFLMLGVLLMIVYAVSGGGYLAFVVFGYQAAWGRALVIGWTILAAAAAALLVGWITAVNIVYLLLQIAIAVEDVSIGEACGIVARLIRARFRELSGVFLVVLVMIVAATAASFIALSGVGLIAFVPLVGLAVFPLQIVAWLLRGLVFEYIGLSALGAYLTLYRRDAADPAFATTAPVRASAEPASPHQAS